MYRMRHEWATGCTIHYYVLHCPHTMYVATHVCVMHNTPFSIPTSNRAGGSSLTLVRQIRARCISLGAQSIKGVRGNTPAKIFANSGVFHGFV